jgi:hypothetical protein
LVRDIPNNVTHLILSNYFNYELSYGVIPNSVTHFTFGHNFNKLLKIGNIPNSVTNLTISRYFNDSKYNDFIPKKLM